MALGVGHLGAELAAGFGVVDVLVGDQGQERYRDHDQRRQGVDRGAEGDEGEQGDSGEAAAELVRAGAAVAEATWPSR